MQLLKLVAEQIQIGGPLPFHVRNSEGGLLLARGQMVQSASQLHALLERGMYADQEELLALEAGKTPPAEAPPLTTRWSQAVWSVDTLLKKLSEGEHFIPACEAVGSEVIALAQEDGDLALYQAVRQEQQQLKLYGVSHSLHVATLCWMVARRLAWSEERQRLAVKAALTMNASIIELQGALAVSGARPAAAQRELLRDHPEEAVRRLRRAGVQDEEWLSAVAQHHEQAGGKGYPRGLSEVEEMAQLLRLVDVFLAKISPRINRPALEIKSAAREVYEQGPNNPMVASLIKEFGMYPPGELVRLANGDLAVVVRRGASLPCPIVMALADGMGRLKPRFISYDTAKPEYKIVSVEADKRRLIGVPCERFYGLYGLHGRDHLNPTH